MDRADQGENRKSMAGAAVGEARHGVHGARDPGARLHRDERAHRAVRRGSGCAQLAAVGGARGIAVARAAQSGAVRTQYRADIQRFGSQMKSRFLAALSLALALAFPAAHAQLRIEITSGVRDPIPIAVVPFSGGSAAPGGFDVAAVVQQDLESSGRFRGMRRQSMRTTPARSDDVAVADWKADGSDYIVVGRVSPVAGGSQFAVDFELVNLLTGQRLASQRVTALPAAM